MISTIGNDGDYMKVTSAGNVGIGTTTPLQKLDVSGSAYYSGNVGIGSTIPVAKLDVAGAVKAAVVALTDAASVSLDASLGNTFRLSAGGNRTIAVPSNPQNGQKIVIAHYASGAARTLSLTTGSSGAFRYGADLTALTETTSGKTDYITCIYNGTDSRWDVIGYAKGY